MLARINSYALNGLEGYGVGVEVDIHAGLPGFDVVGLPDTAIKESRERVRSAVKNSGFDFTPRKITVNLAPAYTKKEGPIFDLAIAIGLLASTEQAGVDEHRKPLPTIGEYVFLGELSLSGAVTRINGVMPMLISAREHGVKKIVIPYANACEAMYIRGVEVYAVKTLRDAVKIINGDAPAPIKTCDVLPNAYGVVAEDLKYVKGQYSAKRALEIAAAGGHNIIMIGSPGGGKTMLAKCLPGILPDMTESEILETTKIHSVAGILDERYGIVTERPFRSPHHTTSRIALTGGGSSARPGEISYAHNGVLFLDELPEYPRNALEILRQPLEDGVITVSRAARTVEYPANFMLVASMNPCPCGFYGSATHECTCTPSQRGKYMSRISGPLLDRIDLHIEVDEVNYGDLTSDVEVGRVCGRRQVSARRKNVQRVKAHAQRRLHRKRKAVSRSKSYTVRNARRSRLSDRARAVGSRSAARTVLPRQSRRNAQAVSCGRRHAQSVAVRQILCAKLRERAGAVVHDSQRACDGHRRLCARCGAFGRRRYRRCAGQRLVQSYARVQSRTL